MKEKRIYTAVKSGTLDKVPKKYITEESLLQVDENGANCFHWAADRGCLDQIPKEFLTEENLAKEDNEKWNVFHFAAPGGYLNQVPRKFLTKRNLLKKDEDSNNCFHVAAWASELHKIPKEFLTPENLLKERGRKVSPIEIVIRDSFTKRNKAFILKFLPVKKSRKYLKELVKIKERLLKIDGEINPQLNNLINNIKALKKLDEMPSLRV